MPAEQRTWLHHIALGADARSDPPHAILRPLTGLGGVDFLEPGFIMEMGTYVFAPVIRELMRVGYKPGFNLEAAPYDWRIPPGDLETRDHYFTHLAATVERMHRECKIPIVLLAHSMGCRVAHYFSTWAEQRFGKAWCDQHVHSVYAVGGPWLGAGKSGRGSVTGDSMGLPFLEGEECVWFGRRVGSTPLLWPVLSNYWGFHSELFKGEQPRVCFVKRESWIDVEVLSIALSESMPHSDVSRKYYLQLEWRGRKMKTDIEAVVCAASRTVEWRSRQAFQLPVENFGRIMPGVGVLKIGLFSEKFGPDRAVARAEIDLARLLIAKTGRESVAEPGDIRLLEEWDGIALYATAKDGEQPQIVGHLSCVSTFQVPADDPKRPAVPNWSTLKPTEAYAPRTVTDLLLDDGGWGLVSLWESHYAQDPVAQRGLQGLPPKGFRRWHIVYSTGRKTEVGFCVRRKFGRVREENGTGWGRYKLDKSPRQLPGSSLSVQNGIVMETGNTRQPSLDGKETMGCGDGTVPYISLIHPFTWRTVDPAIEVTAQHIHGAEHRAILADREFLEGLLGYVCARPKTGLKAVRPGSTREKVGAWFSGR